jgi:hypothetical protein
MEREGFARRAGSRLAAQSAILPSLTMVLSQKFFVATLLPSQSSQYNCSSLHKGSPFKSSFTKSAIIETETTRNFKLRTSSD